MKMDQFIHDIPKAELNVHIEGCLEPDLIIEFARRNKINLAYKTPQELQNAFQFSNLESFLKLYDENLIVLQTEQDFYDLMQAYLQKAAAQNVRHAEIFFDPQAHVNRGIKFSTVVNGLHRAIKDAGKKLNISAYLIMCIMRDLSVDDGKQMLKEAIPFKEIIAAIGLDSNEQNHPPSEFVDIFTEAREHGFLTVACAGETGPPEYITQAIDLLRVSRIDHGVACIKDPDLIARLSANQIPLTICPVSNIRLGIFPNMRQHPIRKLYEAGLMVTINSDDPAYFKAYINENFSAVNVALKLNKAIVYDLALNSFNASFLEFDDKQKLISELDKFYKKALADKE